jgi:hypothetical protein
MAPLIKHRYVWTAGYLGSIAFFGYNFLGLHSYEPWRNYKSATIKHF